MTYAAILLVGILLGYSLCYIASGSRATAQDKPSNTVTVKRNRPSLRSPLQTNKTSYEQYKLKESGLFDVVRPSKKKTDEIEVGR